MQDDAQRASQRGEERRQQSTGARSRDMRGHSTASMRRGLVAALVIAGVLVCMRAAAFVFPGVRFDADQAIVGLMAKHISECRAFPVFFYGQSYLPALVVYWPHR